MKLRIVVYSFFMLLLASCGSSKRVVKNQKDAGVVLAENKPAKLPSVKEGNHIEKLANSKKPLNNGVLNYIEKYAAIAVKEMHEHKIPASITLAQGILESGSGKGPLASKSNNHFGIKCHTGWQGERVYHDDDEDQECFRKYQYVATSYKDHSEFLTKRSRYAFLFDYGTKDYKKWARGLKKAGYATDKKYPDKLIKIIQNYRLYDFDKIKKRDFKYTQIKEKTTKLKNNNKNYYEVKKGDTLYSLARKFKISVAKLKDLNDLNSNEIAIGQYLLTK